MNKVFVIGLDGMEPSIVEAMLKNGELPFFARLRDTGGYSRLRTTFPAQTPVAWSTFSTGTNPGGHGIFDFLSRDPQTYLPILALNRYEQKNAFMPPRVVNLRGGKAIWDHLTEEGIVSTVIRCPCTFPPDKIKGRMLAGVGVPDLRGGLGTSTYFTSISDVQAESNEKVVPVEFGPMIKTQLIGPRDPKSRSDFTFAITIIPNLIDHSVEIQSEGEPDKLVFRLGAWSDWLRVKFKVGMFQSVKGLVRFHLRSLVPEFELYASPINFDPSAPLFPISYPEDYSGEIEARLGSFYTLGMAEEHDGLINDRFDEAAYLEQCTMVLRERERMMLAELKRFKEGFFFCLYDTPDRLQHMFWRFREPEHPANRRGMKHEFRQVIADHYRSLDRIVGKALQAADDQTLFIVLSDHGMNSFQRGLNLNTWLYENGLLALKSGVQPGEDENDDFFRNVNWGKTQAYSLGLGAIFLNLAGRESQGIVKPEDVAQLQERIASSLTGLTDPKNGKTAVRSVLTREQLYSGPYLTAAPDLLVNFASGYRVSWGTPLGGVPAGLFEDNQKKWGGDHVIDPALVPGVLFMNQPFQTDSASLVDLAPTILSALGVKPGSAMEGVNLIP